MSLELQPLDSAGTLGGRSLLSAGQSAGSSAKSSGFADMLVEQLAEVQQNSVAADQGIEQLATGQSDNIHDVVLAMAKADLSFRLVMEIRNRLIESYQEIMRMQV